MIKYVCQRLWMILYLPWTIYFNFRYLPWKQAVKLPIMLCKPTFRALNGSVKITSEKIKTAMIQLGNHDVSIYKKNGVLLEINGNIVFQGSCRLGSGTSIAVGPSGNLYLSNGVIATAEFKCVCYHKVEIGKNVTFGWECMVIDTSLHKCTLVDIDGGEIITHNKGFAPVYIADYCWVAFRCVIMAGTNISSPKCIIAANSLTNKLYDIKPYTMLAGVPAKVVREGIWMNRKDDKINYNLC